MKKHNNNLSASSHARCKCGRPATIGEWKAGIGIGQSYTCPDCLHRERMRPISRDEFYKSFTINPTPANITH